MMRRLFGLLIVLVLTACLSAAESDEARGVFESLRTQMKQLKTIRAEYTVEAKRDPNAPPVRSKLIYIRDGDRYNITESLPLPDGTERRRQLVFDGLEVKVHLHDPTDKYVDQGLVFGPEQAKKLAGYNDILIAANFAIIKPGTDKQFAGYPIFDKGAEQIAGHDCRKFSYFAPYSPTQRAYIYYWVAQNDSRYFLYKVLCVLGDDITKPVYERTYEYDPSDAYPFPRKVSYRRFKIDDQGASRFGYEKNITVTDLDINAQIEDSVFQFTFPQGTLINVAPVTVGPDQPTDPNDPNAPPSEQRILIDRRTQFSFEPGEHLLFVPVLFENTRYRFALDTGASHSVFDTLFRPKLGEPTRTIKGKSPGNPIVAQMFSPPKAHVGPFGLTDYGDIMVAGIRQFSPILGKEIHGVIGMLFIKEHRIAVDFDNGLLTFLEPAIPTTEAWGHPIMVTYNNMGMPQIKATLFDDTDMVFIVDSGLDATGSIEKALFERVVQAKNLKTAQSLAATVAGTVRMQEARIGKLAIGPLQYEDLIFAQGQTNVLGADFLSRHAVVFDFPNDALYLKPGKEFNRVDEVDMTGIHLLRFPDRTTVHSVDKDSPADKAGVQADDIILKINGKDAAKYRIWQIGNLKRAGDGKQMTLTIKRGDETKNIEFTLKRRI